LQNELGIKLTQCQFDALASFRYNVSAHSWSTLAAAAKAGGAAAIPAVMLRYVKAKDIDTGHFTTKAELVSRRKSEAALFAKDPCPCDGLPPAARRPYYS